jgi:hypothetical protein
MTHFFTNVILSIVEDYKNVENKNNYEIHLFIHKTYYHFNIRLKWYLFKHTILMDKLIQSK